MLTVFANGDERFKYLHTLVVRHKLLGIVIIDSLANALHNSSLWMVLYGYGTRLVRALNTLNHSLARHRHSCRHAQRSALCAEYCLMMP